MAHDPRFTSAVLNGFLDTLNTRIGSGGFLRFYDGTKPANADAALSGNTKLAELALSASPFGAAASRVVTAAAITTDTSADATGTATWATFVTSAGVRVLDGTVGTSGADINMDSVAFTAGADISITSITVSLAL